MIFIACVSLLDNSNSNLTLPWSTRVVVTIVKVRCEIKYQQGISPGPVFPFNDTSALRLQCMQPIKQGLVKYSCISIFDLSGVPGTATLLALKIIDLRSILLKL